MCLQSFEHDEVIAEARTSSDLFRLQAAIAFIEEYKLPSARLKDSRCWDDELPSHVRFQIDVHEHARLQFEPRIRNRQPHTDSARCHIHLRQYLFDLTGEDPARIGIDGNLCHIAGLYAANIILEYLGVDPHAR